VRPRGDRKDPGSHQVEPGGREIRCTLHRATTFDKTKYKRKLHRTAIAGKAPDGAFATMPRE
jgi:hypothetical protein